MRDGDAGFDGFVGAIEIVPCDRVHVGTKHEIGVALPGFELMLLGGADGARDDLENVGRRTAVALTLPRPNDRRMRTRPGAGLAAR